MSSLILPRATVLKKAQDAVADNIAKVAERRAKDMTADYERRAHQEQPYGDLARSVIAALINKGVPIQRYQSPDEATTRLCMRYATMGKDFDIIMEAVKHNPTLQSEWERFCMFLKMAQED